MKRQEEFEIVQETLLSEIEELEQRLRLLKKRVSNKDLIGLGDAIATQVGKINLLIGKYHSGFYVESHIDKELFLETLLKHPTVIDYLNGWQEEVRPTITLDCIEHCWNTCENEPITFYEFWTYE